MKFSFFYHDDAIKEHPFAVIRINIPGVQVEGAASRTKSLAYGVFWKNNRKRCKLFFGFERNELFQQHIEWLRAAIDSLEDYRKSESQAFRDSNSILILPENPDILKTHRVGRVLSSAENIAPADSPCANSSTLKPARRNIHDVLGPLPAIPASSDEYSRWSIRRASGCSGIYEEILDPADDA